jgi:protein-disulfide isomerase
LKVTNAQRAGSRTAERRRERERERRRQQLITGGIVVVALVVIVVVVFFIVNAPAEAPIPQAALTRYEGLQQTRTDEGFPRLGDPNAPVQVSEYSSFDCPHCREFHDQAIDPIIERVRTGEMAFTYVPLYGFGGIVNGQGAAQAAVCAAEQGKFWQFHDALFDWQGVYANQAFTNNRINAGVDALGLNRGSYDACIRSGTPDDVLNAARSQAQALLNFTGTPTIAINGVVPVDSSQQSISDVNAILARIDAELARVSLPPVQPTSVATAEATSEATEPAAAPTTEATPEATSEATAES